MHRELVIGDVFADAARAVPQRTAAVLGERSLTFGELDATANRIANQLASQGIGAGSRVASWCATDLDVVPLFAALAKLGAVFLPLNGLAAVEEAAGIVSRSRPDLVVVDDGHRHGARGLATDVAELGELVEESRRRPASAPSSVVGEDDTHVAFFTSGSTGAPKGVVLSHRVNHLRSQAGALLEPRGAMVCPYPLFHMGAWTIALQQWQARDAVVLLEQASADAICEALARHRATRLNAIPAVWRRVLAHVEGMPSPSSPLASLRFADSGTSATPLELLEAMEAAAPGAHIRVFYGSTEAGSVAALAHGDIGARPGSCGVPGPGVRVRLADGELQVRSTMLFGGYLDDAAATEAAFAEGWYRTGDLAAVDDDGYLTIVGRLGEVVRTGGESVDPARVEEVLAGHPAVADVAVVGLPDATWGEILCAVVVPVAGEEPTLEALRLHCRGRLAPFQEPRRLAFVEVIPRTASTGQVQRRLLVEQLG